jgi:hypothetical protein
MMPCCSSDLPFARTVEVAVGEEPGSFRDRHDWATSSTEIGSPPTQANRYPAGPASMSSPTATDSAKFPEDAGLAPSRHHPHHHPALRRASDLAASAAGYSSLLLVRPPKIGDRNFGKLRRRILLSTRGNPELADRLDRHPSLQGFNGR